MWINLIKPIKDKIIFGALPSNIILSFICRIMSVKTNSSEKFWNVPNCLSLYRLCSFPLLVYFILSNQESLFIGFLLANLITDILDGILARVLKQCTKIGAQLDSIADIGSYILAVWGIYVFRWEGFAQNPWPFFCFITLYVLAHLYVLVKFKKIVGLHMYSFKILGYIQGTFIGITFLFQFYPSFYLFAMFAGIAVCIEEMVVIYVLPYPMQNVKGLYWVIKNLKQTKHHV